MKTIKYSNNNNDFVIELRKNVKAYFEDNKIETNGNKAIIFKAVFMIVLYMAPFALLLSGWVQTALGAMICFFFMGLGMAALGMSTMHDANHGSFSKSRRVNRFFSKSLYLLGGFPPNWRFQHNTLHHGYTNIDGHDEDIGPVGILRFSPHQPLKRMHRFQYLYAWFLYGLMTFSWITVKDFNRIIKYRKMGAPLSGTKSFAGLLTDLILSKVLYYAIFLVLPILLAPVAWYWILVGFLGMHFYSGLILSTIFQSAHVVPSSGFPLPNDKTEMEKNWMAHQLYTTSDFSPNNRFFSWFIGGLNYQVIHHLFPNISHIHYRKLAPIVERTAKKYGIPYHVNKTFYGAVHEHIKMLKKLGTEVNWQIANNIHPETKKPSMVMAE
jgi:linoleoyl-CoA desaturase